VTVVGNLGPDAVAVAAGTGNLHHTDLSSLSAPTTPRAKFHIMHTVTLVITALSLPVRSTITLLCIAALVAILGIRVVVVLLLMLLLRLEAPAVRLTRVEHRSPRLEAGSSDTEAPAASALLGVATHVQLLLCLARQVFVLRRRVVFPRVEVRHSGEHSQCLVSGRRKFRCLDRESFRWVRLGPHTLSSDWCLRAFRISMVG